MSNVFDSLLENELLMNKNKENNINNNNKNSSNDIKIEDNIYQKFEKYNSTHIIIRKYLQKTESSLKLMLINEIQKEKFPSKELLKNNKIKKSQFLLNPSYRNIPLLSGLMKKLFPFQKFIYSNNINDYHLNNILNNFEYLQIEKNKYIYNKNDYAENFYLIIQGKVIIKSLANEKNEYERRNSILTEGDCFGELELLDNKLLRISSCFSLENCDLFYLSKENFDSYLFKIMRKNIQLQKNFLIENISPFSKSNLLDIIDKTLEKIVLKKNDILYYENDPAEYLYIVYDGEFAVKKNIFHKKDKNFISETENNENKKNKDKNKKRLLNKSVNSSNLKYNKINYENSNKENIYERRKENEYYLKLPIMLILSKGEFIGLESIKNYKLYFQKYKEIERKIEEENNNNQIIFDLYERSKSRNLLFNNKLRNEKNKINNKSDFIDNIFFKKENSNLKDKKKINIEIENKYKYESTIIAKKDFNLVYKLKPKVIAHNIFGLLNQHFNDIIEHRNSIIDLYYKKYNEISEEIRVIYRDEIIKNKIYEENGRLRKIKIKKLDFSPKKKIEKKPNLINTLISQFSLKKKNHSNLKESKNQIHSMKTLFLTKLNNSERNSFNHKLNCSNSLVKMINSQREKRNINKSSDLIYQSDIDYKKYLSNKNKKKQRNYIYNSGNYHLPLYSNIIKKNIN